MEFNKEKFLKNAPKGILRQLKDHLDILDGVEVIFDGRYGKDGYIPQYFVNGQEYHLYPVCREWCVEKQLPGQMQIEDYPEVLP